LYACQQVRLIEALEDLYPLRFITDSELSLMKQVTEKQLVVESLVRALRRYDAYYRAGHDRQQTTDWTDDRSVFPDERKRRR
jgi:hypothetical protein